MKTKLNIGQVTCGVCANSLADALYRLQGVFGVDVDVAAHQVTVEHTDEVSLRRIAACIRSLSSPGQEVDGQAGASGNRMDGVAKNEK